jgi:DMSO reductase anchor subunit
MRVLDSIEVSSDLLSVNSHQALWKIPGTEHPYPLPTYSRTEPYLAIKPHAAMSNGLGKVISNWEEVRTPKPDSKVGRLWRAIPKSGPYRVLREDFGLQELPLVAFTLLAQLAVGMAVFALPLTDIPFSLLLTVGITLGFAGIFSFLHLGSPLNAWRAFNNLSKSWLSRESLMTGLFAGSWLLTLISPGFGKWLLAITGIGLVYSMAQVYRLKSAPGWNSWRTPVSFFLSAGMLGALAVNFWLYQPLLPLVAALLLAVEAVTLPEARPAHKTARQARVSLIRAGILAALIISFLQESLSAWANVPIFLIVFAEEILGRWLFYESREN